MNEVFLAIKTRLKGSHEMHVDLAFFLNELNFEFELNHSSYFIKLTKKYFYFDRNNFFNI
jgi:hypothetical protein